MNKIDLVLDMVEHPEKYSADELERLLSDAEVRDICRDMCLISTAVSSDADEAGKCADVDREWKAFERKYMRRSLVFGLLSRRVAAAVAVLVSSAVAVAIGLGLKYVVSEPSIAEDEKSVEHIEASDISEVVPAEEAVEQPDSVRAVPDSNVFEDETLAGILARIAKAYGVSVRIQNTEAGNLRLYYKWNPSDPIAEVVAQLNGFDSFDVALVEGVIVVK